MRENPLIDKFINKLNAADVTYRRLWSAKRDPKAKRDDVHFLEFIGKGFSPAINTAILIDYGKRDGFGLYVDNMPVDFDATVAEIAKPRETKPAGDPLALLREAVDAWPLFDIPEAMEAAGEVNGGDLVEWFGDWRAKAKDLLAGKPIPNPANDDALDLLALALPYVEDQEKDPVNKPGVVAKLAKRMRALIERIG